jgi:hypothetical protein
MLNLRFKNPYIIDELCSLEDNNENKEENKEVVIKQLPNFTYKDNNNFDILSICKFDKSKILAAKGI